MNGPIQGTVFMRRLPLLVIVLAIAGCDRAETVRMDNGIVILRVRDYRYDSQQVRVRSGPVTFKLYNDGTGATNLRVRRAERKRDLASISTLAPGGLGSTTVSLRPGRYVMYSSITRHETLGEYGELIVTRR